jgi:hypothetical protein
VVTVLNRVYEAGFLGFSYGFRPGRGAHDGLDAPRVGLMGEKVNWVLDADIRGFFDAICHGWPGRSLEHRIADRRVLRLIRKWLRAGVSEDGRWSKTEVGTPQGAVASPLLANVLLHYAFDLWARQWRTRSATGDPIAVRYADDFVVGFQHRRDAERFLRELGGRFAKFGLALHPGKTRLIEFGRLAAEDRRRRGEGEPETFTFLGFTRICGRKHWSGGFIVKRIGSVYETIMGFNLEVARGRSIAIKPTKPHGAPTTINLEELLAVKPADRRTWLKDQTDQSLTVQALNALKEAKTPEDADERSPDILRLRELHAAMDRAVLDAYGWTDLQPTCEFLLDYEEDDDEDESGGGGGSGSGSGRRRKKPWRYRWPDDVRDEVLARLLELNRRRAEQERLSGAASQGKAKSPSKSARKSPNDGQPGLF